MLLEAPFTEAKIRALEVGQMVEITGLVYTGRDAVHKYLHDGGKPPVDLRDSIIYHCGPVVVEEKGKWVVKAAGPTTSIREEAYQATVMKKYGAPEDLFISIEDPSIPKTNELMKQCDLVIATGGQPMVRAAHSSGTPAFGVGAALCLNPPDAPYFLRWRFGAVALTVVYTLILLVVATPAGVFTGGLLPLMMVGFADEYSMWAAARPRNASRRRSS